MLNIKSIREGFRDQIFFNIEFIRISQNLSEGGTEIICQASLRELITKGRQYPVPDQWIIRK